MQTARATEAISIKPSVRDIGAEMARLRAGFGLSQQQVSQRLHIRARYIAAIESGRLEDLPGLVYARGYVHTYAEFLGIDPDATVERCFAVEGAVASVVRHRPPPSTRPKLASSIGGMRNLLMVFVGLLALVMVAGKFSADKHAEAPAAPAVAPVPEEMLATVRTLVMPTPRNRDCLTIKTWLACYFDDALTQEVAATWSRPFYFAPDIDVTGLALPEPVPAEPVAAPAPAAAEVAPAADAASETPPHD